MGFFKTIKQIASGGKSEDERKYLAAANIQIRKKALAAELKEREKQNIRLSRERIRLKAEQKLQGLKSKSSPIKNISSSLGINLNKYSGLSKNIKKRKRWDPIFGGYR